MTVNQATSTGFRRQEGRSAGHRRKEHGRMAQLRHKAQAGARDGRRFGRRLGAAVSVIFSALAVATIPAIATDLDYVVERAAMIRTLTAYSSEVRSTIG